MKDLGHFPKSRDVIVFTPTTHKRRLLAYLDAGHPVGANLHE
jgi:hypothetical protein